jgi:predicted RNA-binding Zn-ribbon protein involved in translation (DUF1610 family)
MTTASPTPRYHGFTCPNCGSHMFGTHTHYRLMGDKYPHGTSVGQCQAFHHSQTDCRFEWNRDDPKAEAECMYEQTETEWQAGRAAFLASLSSAA